jgi:hypothetical protein
MKVRSLHFRLAIASILLLASVRVCAQDGVKGALARLNRTTLWESSSAPLLGSTLAIADFDNDHRPDGAVLLESGPFLRQANPQIELHFTGRKNTHIALESSNSELALAALDIDHDGNVDLVVEQSLTHKRLQVWLNDGRGNFAKGRIEDFPPAAFPVHEQLRPPAGQEAPLISLPSQRGSELLMLVACHIAGRPPSSSKDQAARPFFSPDSRTSSTICPRAPPTLHS